MTPAHRIETILSEDGKLALDQLPFRAGQAVEIIVLPMTSSNNQPPQSLQGTVIEYTHPTEPVAEQDWEVLE